MGTSPPAKPTTRKRPFHARQRHEKKKKKKKKKKKGHARRRRRCRTRCRRRGYASARAHGRRTTPRSPIQPACGRSSRRHRARGELGLRRSAGDGDHPRPGSLGDLHRRRPAPAGRRPLMSTVSPCAQPAGAAAARGTARCRRSGLNAAASANGIESGMPCSCCIGGVTTSSSANADAREREHPVARRRTRRRRRRPRRRSLPASLPGTNGGSRRELVPPRVINTSGKLTDAAARRRGPDSGCSDPGAVPVGRASSPSSPIKLVQTTARIEHALPSELRWITV